MNLTERQISSSLWKSEKVLFQSFGVLGKVSYEIQGFQGLLDLFQGFQGPLETLD